MSCRYKEECPSCTGWCEGPKQDFSQCIPFLITSREHWKHEAQKQAACAGEFRILLAKRLLEVKKNILILASDFQCENSQRLCTQLAAQISTLENEKEWIEGVLCGKGDVIGKAD